MNLKELINYIKTVVLNDGHMAHQGATGQSRIMVKYIKNAEAYGFIKEAILNILLSSIDRENSI